MRKATALAEKLLPRFGEIFRCALRLTVAVGVLLGVLLASLGTVSVGAMGTSAQAHILIDARTGLVLSGYNEHQRLKMASTTKIMTTLLALEQASVEDKVVTFTEAMFAEGSSMYLRVGDKLRLSDLAAGMMMASGNDAANAVALSLSDSFEGFAQLMNNKARSFRMKNTSFVTPGGLDDDNHYSTAYDMAVLMMNAMNNQSFSELTAATEKTVEFIYPQGKISVYQNHNKLLKSYSWCIGGKTGYTKASGRCLVSCAEKDGVRLIAVTLNAPDDWNDHKALYEYGFSLYTEKVFDESKTAVELKLSGSKKKSLKVIAENSVTLTVPASMINQIERTFYLPSFVFAPVKKGDRVGKIIYTLDGQELGTVYLVAADTAQENTQSGFWSRLISAIFNRD